MTDHKELLKLLLNSALALTAIADPAPERPADISDEAWNTMLKAVARFPVRYIDSLLTVSIDFKNVDGVTHAEYLVCVPGEEDAWEPRLCAYEPVEHSKGGAYANLDVQVFIPGAWCHHLLVLGRRAATIGLEAYMEHR